MLGGMLGGMLGALIGYGAAYFAARKVASLFPNWLGVAASLVAGCATSTVLALVVTFGGGILFELGGLRLGHQWYVLVIGGGFWLSLPGSIWGGVRGRKIGIARREALDNVAHRTPAPSTGT